MSRRIRKIRRTPIKNIFVFVCSPKKESTKTISQGKKN
jgi:hypothetical protein